MTFAPRNGNIPQIIPKDLLFSIGYSQNTLFDTINRALKLTFWTVWGVWWGQPQWLSCTGPALCTSDGPEGTAWIPSATCRRSRAPRRTGQLWMEWQVFLTVLITGFHQRCASRLLAGYFRSYGIWFSSNSKHKKSRVDISPPRLSNR